MRDPAPVLGELLVGLDLWSRSDFLGEPLGEGLLLGDFAGGFETGDDGGCVVAFGIREVLEVEGGLDGWVRGGQVDASSGTGTRDVGCHAEGVEGGFVA